MRPLVVRTAGRMVFEVNRETLEPVRCSSYDAWAYSDPQKDVEYMEHSDWCMLLHAARRRRGAEP